MSAQRVTSLFITDEEFSQKSLLQKWSDHFHGRNRNKSSLVRNSRVACVFFLFTCISEAYTVMAYSIPYCYQDKTAYTQYLIKVWAVFVLIQCLSNYFCTRCYDTSYKNDIDSPDLRKSLWDDHPAQFPNGNNNDITPKYQYYTVNKKEAQWKRCEICALYAPPRSHHCKLCDKCILKRDHHCYLTGVCIGYFNQRYFIVLVFYTTIACSWGLYLTYYYMKEHVYPITAFMDYILPVSIYRWLQGHMRWHILLMISHLYTLLITGLMAVGFFCWQMFVILQGRTSQEVLKNKSVTLKPIGTIAENIRSVFGNFWLFNFIIPAQIIFRQPGDGIHW